MNYIFYKEENDKIVATETVSEEDFNRIDEAAQYVMRVYRVEEIFHMIMSALLEFNSEVFKKADLMRIAEDDAVETEMFRFRINQCAATFLTSIDMYHEYLQPDNGTKPFSISTDKFEDSRFKACKAIRNYIQHVSTMGVNIRWDPCACACGEKLSSLSVSANTIEMKRHMYKLHTKSAETLSALIGGKDELNVYGIFNDVVDLLFDIHNEVRASKEYTVEYKSSAQFLSKLYNRLTARGFYSYHFDGDDELECRGPTPYFYDRKLKAIDYWQRRYRYDNKFNKGSFYATTAPQNMVNRIAEADKIVERYVKNNGVVAEFDNGNQKIIRSQFTTDKMRKWYLPKHT